MISVLAKFLEFFPVFIYVKDIKIPITAADKAYNSASVVVSVVVDDDANVDKIASIIFFFLLLKFS